MYFLSFFLGFCSSFLGFLAPSMLNITATKISLENNKKTAINFSFGVSIIVVLQSSLALLFFKAINENPFVLEYIHSFSILIFSILSFVFFRKAFLERKKNTSKKTINNGFLTGLGLALVNMFAIPFYSGLAAVFNMNGWLELDRVSIFLFVAGTCFGIFFLLYCYILLAEKIKSQITRFAKYLNFILGAITGIVTVIYLIKML